MKTTFRTLDTNTIKAFAARHDAEEDAQDIAAELLHLRAEVAALRAGTLRDQVSAFHRMIGAPILATPQVPADGRVRLRARLIAEEFFEAMAALFEDGVGQNSQIDRLHFVTHEFIGGAPVRVDLPEFVDALGDLDYVIEGSRLEFGVIGAPIAAEIHQTNMAKADGPVDEHGKKRKPAGWQPPDIAGLLRAQGWQS